MSYSLRSDIQYAALTAIVNSTSGCDANRQYMSELNGILPLLETIKTTSNHAIMLEAIKALVNMAFTSKYVSGCILSDGGDIVLVEVIQGCDILRQPLLAHSALAALTNLCTYAPTQTHVGHTEGLVEVAVLVIKHTKQAFVVAQAASLLLAVMWKNMANKIRVGTKNACAALVQRIVQQSNDLSDESLHCLERLCHAVATFCFLTPNQEIMKTANGNYLLTHAFTSFTHQTPILLRHQGNCLNSQENQQRPLTAIPQFCVMRLGAVAR